MIVKASSSAENLNGVPALPQQLNDVKARESRHFRFMCALKEAARLRHVSALRQQLANVTQQAQASLAQAQVGLLRKLQPGTWLRVLYGVSACCRHVPL